VRNRSGAHRHVLQVKIASCRAACPTVVWDPGTLVSLASTTGQFVLITASRATLPGQHDPFIKMMRRATSWQPVAYGWAGTESEIDRLP
jgi:hypothetical protein